MTRSVVGPLVVVVFSIGCTELNSGPRDAGKGDSSPDVTDGAADKGNDARTDAAADQAQDQVNVDARVDGREDAANADSGGVDAPDTGLPDGGETAPTAILSLAPGAGASADFGTVGVGSYTDKTFFLTNDGQKTSSAVTIVISGAGFALLPTADGDCQSGTTMVAPGAPCTVRVRFTPMAEGSVMGMLSASATSGGMAKLAVTGMGQTGAMLGLRPAAGSAAAFGTVVIGAGADQTFVLSNDGQQTTSAVTITLTGNGFTLVPSGSGDCGTGKVLSAGDKCTIQVHFAPTGDGAATAMLQAGAVTGGMVSLKLTATGQTPAALLLAVASGSSASYDTVTVGTTKDQTFVLSNSGQQASTAITVALTGGTGFTVLTGATGDCVSGTTALESGASCNIRVRFTADSGGPASVLLKATADTGGSQSLVLSANGQTSPSLTLAAASGSNSDFGTVVVGTTKDQTFVLTNTGQQMSSAVNFSLASGGFSVLAPAGDDCISGTSTLAASATCTIRVRFAPVTGGASNVPLNVVAATGGTASLTLNGTGVTPAVLVVAAAPGSSGDFGTVVVNATRDQTFVVTNSGQQASSAITVTVTGAGFMLVPAVPGDCDSGTTTLTSGATCNVHVRFMPAAAGPGSGALAISAATGGNPSLSLAGQAQTPAALALGPAPGSFADFGGVVVGATKDQTYVLSNGGQQGSTVVSFSLSGDGFTLLAPGTGDCIKDTTTLAGSGSCTIHVRFAPSAAGNASAMLNASAATGGSVSLKLTGTAQTIAHLTLAPAPSSSTSFGTVVVGLTSDQTFVLTNVGQQTSGPVTVSLSGAGFMVLPPTGGDCVSGATALIGDQSCTIRVRFAPMDPGGAMATLSASGTPGGMASLMLSGNGQSVAMLGLAPASGFASNFGTVFLGSSNDQTFQLSNGGQQMTTAVSFSLSSTGTAFTLLTPISGDCVSGTTTLAGGARCNIRVRFAPSGAGPVTVMLGASASTGGAPMLTLTGTGQTGAALSLAPGPTFSNDFGTVLLSSSKTQTFVLSNGGQQMTTAISFSLPAGAAFQTLAPTGNDCISGTTMLAGSGNCTIRVQFTPIAAGPTSALLSASAATGGGAMLSLTGTGQTVAAIALAAAAGSSAAYGAVGIGGTKDQTFVVSNTGGQTSGPVTVSTSGAFSVLPAGAGDCVSGTTTLMGGTTCTVRVRFTPAGSAGVSAMLLASAMPGGSGMLTLTGSGLTLPAVSLAAGAGYTNDFGTVYTGATRDQTYVVTNTGQQRSGVVTLSVNGTGFSILPASGTDCVSGTTALDAGATCNIRVRFAPFSGGPASAMLGAAVVGSSAVIGLTGNAQVGATLSAASQDFGVVAAGATRTIFVQLLNVGQQTSGPIAITLGAGSPTFSISNGGPIATPCLSGTTTLAGNGTSCLVQVSFTPPSGGPFSGRIDFSASPGGSVSIQLTGQAQSSFVQSISSGATADHTCAVLNYGDVYCWGNNSNGQVSASAGTTPAATRISGISGATAVVTGTRHTCAVLGGETVMCWGLLLNDAGQLVNAPPTPFYNLAPTAITAGNNFTCALRADGTVFCWGIGTSGQLGNGRNTNSSMPVQVPGLNNVTAISAGNAHVCAVVAGNALCWGANDRGQLGLGGSGFNVSTPTTIPDLGGVAIGISAGYAHTCAWLNPGTSGGQVRCWGRNDHGQLGNSSTADAPSPVTTSNLSGAFTYGVVAGGVHTCGSFQSGAACWGEGGAGQLGTGNNLSSLVPTFLTLPDGVSALSANNQHSCAIILGAVSCWGAGDLNQLGQTGSQGGSSQPINVALP